MSNRLHETVPTPLAPVVVLHGAENPLTVPKPSVVPTGSGSVKFTAVAVSGPLFLTMKV